MPYTLIAPPADPGNTGKLATAPHSTMHIDEQLAIVDLDLRVTARELARYTWGSVRTSNLSLALADLGTIIPASHATGFTVTVTKQATVVWTPGDSMIIKQVGAGPITIAADTGVTINPPPGLPSGGTLLTLAQNAWVELIRTATTNVWDIVGALQVRERATWPVPLTPLGANATTGDKIMMPVPAIYAGYAVVGITLALVVPATGGSLPSVGVRRVRAGSGVEVLSTNVTVDLNETDSKDATTAAVINSSNSTLALADQLIFHVDQVGTGGSQGFVATLILN